jgi:hypothetical protein
MPADVHPVSLVPDRARDAADLVAGFKHDGNYVGPSQKFQRRGEAGWSRANDNRSFRHQLL